MWNEEVVTKYKALSRHCLERLNKTTKDSQDRRFLGRDLKPGTSQIEAGVITSRP